VYCSKPCFLQYSLIEHVVNTLHGPVGAVPLIYFPSSP